MEVPADRKWGVVRDDGTVTGMVGEVHYRRAHLAINEITITGMCVEKQIDMKLL